MFFKRMMSLSATVRHRFALHFKNASPKCSKQNPRNNMVFGFVACNFLSTQRVTKNIELTTDSDSSIIKDPQAIVKDLKENRPLLILMRWLLSKPRHIKKFVDLYIEQGFDVVTVSVTPWQLLWPAKGSRLVAYDLLEFLDNNRAYEQIVIHGFSVAGYFCGEIMDLILADPQRFDHVIHRVIGQIWDSAVDISEFTIGAPKAMFPNNKKLELLMKKYLEYHLKVFHVQSTQYYLRSSYLFHQTLLRAPALFIVSDKDPVGNIASNKSVQNCYDELGLKTEMHIFKNTPHVGHFHRYPKEYVALIYKYLDEINMIKNEEKIRKRL